MLLLVPCNFETGVRKLPCLMGRFHSCRERHIQIKPHMYKHLYAQQHATSVWWAFRKDNVGLLGAVSAVWTLQAPMTNTKGRADVRPCAGL